MCTAVNVRDEGHTCASYATKVPTACDAFSKTMFSACPATCMTAMKVQNVGECGSGVHTKVIDAAVATTPAATPPATVASGTDEVYDTAAITACVTSECALEGILCLSEAGCAIKLQELQAGELGFDDFTPEMIENTKGVKALVDCAYAKCGDSMPAVPGVTRVTGITTPPTLAVATSVCNGKEDPPTCVGQDCKNPLLKNVLSQSCPVLCGSCTKTKGSDGEE